MQAFLWPCFLKQLKKKKNSLSTTNTINHAFAHQILIKVWWKKDQLVLSIFIIYVTGFDPCFQYIFKNKIKMRIATNVVDEFRASKSWAIKK